MSITTKEISDNIISQLETSLNQTIPLLPKAFNRVLAKALAAVFVIVYKYANWMLLQQFVATASFRTTKVLGMDVRPLVFWGRLIGVGDPKPATAAELNVSVTVLTQGGTLANNTQLTRAETGVTYITIGAVNLDAPSVIVTVRAASDQAGNGGLGTIGNLEPGDTLTFANPQGQVAQEAVVAAQVVTAAEAETEDQYRQRVIDRFQKRPQGGAYSDYELWGEEAPGIVNVYPYTGDPGQVNVYSEATPESSGDPDGIPTTAQLQSVLDLINFNNNGLANRRNANAFVNSLPITRTGFNVTVVGITGVSDLAQVQTDVTTAVTEYFLSTEPFIAGLSVPPRRDQITRTRVSAIVEDIVTAAGGTFSSAGFALVSAPAFLEAYVLGEGEKAKAASVVFT